MECVPDIRDACHVIQLLSEKDQQREDALWDRGIGVVHTQEVTVAINHVNLTHQTGDVLDRIRWSEKSDVLEKREREKEEEKKREN